MRTLTTSSPTDLSHCRIGSHSRNFATAWSRGGLKHYLPNSFIITLPSLFLTLLLSSFGAYALARFNFKGNRLLFYTFVGGMLLPFQVLMLPVFRLTDALGLYDTYWA